MPMQKTSLLRRYADWLHLKWPAGRVEQLPEVGENGETAVRGLRIIGDLTGIPLLKFALDSGARAARAIADELKSESTSPAIAAQRASDAVDLVIIGGGVAGIAAAIEAKSLGMSVEVFESAEPFSTIVNFPRAKPIYTYPTDMTPTGAMHVTAEVKESLLDELESQRIAAGINPTLAHVHSIRQDRDGFVVEHATGRTRARRVIIAIGRSGGHRKLNIPGESLPKVYNRLHDPAEFKGQSALVVGGGDSAIETALALQDAGASVSLSYRGESLSRPKPANIEKLERARAAGSIQLFLRSEVLKITDHHVDLKSSDGRTTSIPNNVVFTMIGREAPLGFLRKAGIPILGDWTPRRIATFAIFLLACLLMYHWKSSAKEIPIQSWFQSRGWFPFNIDTLFGAAGTAIINAANSKRHLLYTLRESMRDGGFYYSLAYCLCVVAFGLQRIRKRKTPYVRLQTITLALIQCIPLFLLPQILLPWAGHNGWFDSGVGAWVGRNFFPDGSYWRAYGFILAWPLFIWNLFTDQPIWGWLIVSFLQTFVLIPLIVHRYGKGAYCGWICSCGALAETLGDEHRHKMPHGPFWNRLNLVGQVILAAVFLLLLLRIITWIAPSTGLTSIYKGLLSDWRFINYKWLVDLMIAGVIGVGCYFWLSGRVWCRFACPLAALMHIYARFTRFRIFAEKSKCISCNVCTSVCHQGIDVMNFANKGQPMEDPQCVRCSACVQSCPTGVLSFGRLDKSGRQIPDRIPASLVRIEEVGLPHPRR